MSVRLTLVATGLVAVLICCMASWGQPPQRPEYPLFDNGNIYAVRNGPHRPTRFTLQERCRISRITTYHWNDARGAAPGTISLRDAAGNVIGPWSATTRPGQGGVPNAYWDVFPNATLEPGTYSVLDSDPGTWACNAENGNRGMCQVYGRPSRHH